MLSDCNRENKVQFILQQDLKSQRRIERSLSAAYDLYVVGGLDHTHVAFLRVRDPLPIVQEAVLTPGPMWTIVGNFSITVIRSPDGRTRRESLYRLNYSD